MRILVVYYQEYEGGLRSTINEHLYSFGRYSGEECHYLNAAADLPSWVARLSFDLVIYHYTICACKWNPDSFRKLHEKWAPLKRIAGYKVAMPQDEYVQSDELNRFFKEFGIQTIFTCLPSSEWHKVYPKEKSGVKDFVNVYTGYIDESSLERIERFAGEERKIDIGYRARKLPYWLGRHGCLKWELAERFRSSGAEHGLKLDISTDPSDVFHGDEWYRFLARCRCVLGCEGGASLHDPDGAIRRRVDAYVAKHPSAAFEEVERECFLGLDGNLDLMALSPRHFECCMTRTCQVLVEGEYGGVFKPGVHYIEVRKDWSNIEEVLRKVADKDYCRLIAENAYRDIVGSGLYTYRKFVENVIDHVEAVSGSARATELPGNCYLKLLDLRERYRTLFMYRSFLKYSARNLFRAALDSAGLLETYDEMKRKMKAGKYGIY